MHSLRSARLWSAATVVLALVITPLATSPRAAQAPSPSDSVTKARTFAAELRDASSLPALQLAVSVKDVIVAAESVGFADVPGQVPLTNANQFRIGSVSKLLTATAAVRLVQAGKLDLDAHASRYLSRLPPDKADITPRQLGGHLAGMAHYGADDYISTAHYRDVTESLPRLLALPLLAPPGTKYAYSSYGFNVLGGVLQGAAGKEFHTVIAEQILGPLGMTHTIAEDSPHPPAERVKLYTKDADGQLRDAPYADLSDRWPSGGFLSTAGDLVRFASGLSQARFLRAPERELLFTSQRNADGKETGVGLGWRIGRDPAGRRYLHHGGDAVGGRAFVLLYPDEDVAVALLTNLNFAAVGEKDALRLAGLYLPQ